jgi:ABC-type amino acid transport substrate-binding protein
VDAIVEAGMEPVLTLHHYAWPLHLQDAGGLIAPEFPERFAAYTARVVRALGGRVRWWVTFNEPDQLVYGYMKPWWQGEYRMPPGLPAGVTLEQQLRCARLLMRSLFAANARARQTIREARPDAMVGANPFVLGVPRPLQWFLDWRTTRLRTEADWDRAGRRAAARPPSVPPRVDIVAAALSATAERGQDVEFSLPYRVASIRLLTRADAGIAGASDLAGRTVAVVRGSTAESGAGDLLPGAIVLSVADYEAGVAAVADGRAAALLGDDVALAGLAARAPGRFAVGEPLRRERHVVAVPSGSRQLLQIVNDAISGAAPAPLPARPGPNLRRVLRRRRLVAGVSEVPGVAERDPATGGWSGEEVDIARGVAERVFGDPDRVTFEPLQMSERVRALRPWTRVLDPLLRSFDFALCALNGNWWHLGLAGRLPEWLCPADCVGEQDYVGLDYYWGIRSLAPGQLRALADAAAGDFAHAPVWPSAMRRVLHSAARLFPGQPVLIVENGSVTVASGMDRVAYIREHVRQTMLARAEGVPVAGYLCWAITSNREWGLPFGPANDFGLYHVDLDTDPALTRVATEAAAAYAELIRDP